MQNQILEIQSDIRIIDLDHELTSQSPTAPSLRYMYLKLSNSPSEKWAEFFLAERQYPRHTMWREAWINDNYIIVDCVPEELPAKHLPYLKDDVSNANKKYNDFLARQKRAEMQLNKEESEERERILKVKKGLDFS
jgi:hypothetical protein